MNEARRGEGDPTSPSGKHELLPKDQGAKLDPAKWYINPRGHRKMKKAKKKKKGRPKPPLTCPLAKTYAPPLLRIGFLLSTGLSSIGFGALRNARERP